MCSAHRELRSFTVVVTATVKSGQEENKIYINNQKYEGMMFILMITVKKISGLTEISCFHGNTRRRHATMARR